MSDYFDLKNEFNSMVEKARIELKGDCPLIEDAAILAASERIAELEGSLIDIYMNELGLSYDDAVEQVEQVEQGE